MSTITGTTGPDSLDGTAGDDSISGLNGNDTLNGLGGSDTLNGGDGDDKIITGGGLGYDHVDGGAGNNLLVADFSAATGGLSSGSYYILQDNGLRVDYSNIQQFNVTAGGFADNILTGAGDDTVLGMAGDDVLNTGAGNAVVNGGADNDTWAADLSATTANGKLDLSKAGAQSYVGSTVTSIEAVQLTTGSGNNTVLTLTGASHIFNDTITGGTGNDTFGVGGGYDHVDGMGGTNTLIVDFTDATSALSSGSYYIYEGDSNFRVDFANIQNFNVTGGASNDTVTTFAGDDTLRGNGGDDFLNTAAGRATVDGGAGNDTWLADLSAATGNSALNLNTAATQTFDGNSVSALESVRLTLGSGKESVLTLTGASHLFNDYIDAGANNDTIGVGGGYDTVLGGDGVDKLIVDFTDANFGISDGGGGSYFYEGDNNYRVDYSGIEQFDLTGSAFSDNVHFGAGDDVFHGNAGDDRVDTSTGNATVDGGAGNDTWAADLSASSLSSTLDLSKAAVQSFDGSSVVRIEALAISAGSGNDKILTLTGASHLFNDAVNGGGGNDTIGVGGGYDTVDGGLGDNRLIVDFTDANAGIFGNGSSYFYEGDNTYRVDYANIQSFDFTGGAFGDNVSFGAGDDAFRGNGGDDVVNTSTGNATVDGGAGTDTWAADLSANTTGGSLDLNKGAVQAFDGSSVRAIESVRLTTGSGADSVLTLTGATHLYNDAVTGGAGNDTVSVGGGYDTVDGGDDNDTLIIDFAEANAGISGNGSSYLYEGDNNWRVDYANIENFDFTGSAYVDNVSFGAGDDVFHGNDGDDVVNTSTGLATVDGGAGNDTWAADFSSATASGTLDLSQGGAQQFFGGRITSVESVRLTTGSGADKVLTLSGVGQTFNDQVAGGAGNDTIGVGGGHDTVDGGADTDTLIVDFSNAATGLSGNGSSYLYEGDSLYYVEYSGFELFSIKGGAFADNIAVSGAGNDTLDGGAGADTLGGADGDDTLIGGAAADALNGGGGSDTASYATSTTGLTVSLLTPGSNTGDAAGDSYNSVENLRGSEFNDDLTGDGADNVLQGGAGNDNLDGGAGSDTASYAAASGAVTVSLAVSGSQNTGGAGTDALVSIENLLGSAFNDTLAGSSGDNVLNGAGGVDTVTYAAAAAGVTVSLAPTASQVTGGAGTDTVLNFENITGSGFADTLTGDDGDNRIDGGAGVDTMVGGGGNDTYIVDAAADVITEAAAGGTDSVISSATYTLSLNVETLTLTGSADLNGTGNTSANVITGNTGNNSLNGAQGADTLSGGGGADTLNGGTGADSMTGGAAGDTYVVDNIGDIVVEGAVAGIDSVQASVSYALSANVENLLLTAAGLTGAGNGSDNLLTGSSGADTLIGLVGADTLDGGSGADSMAGGVGDDLYLVDSSGDVVTEASGEGADTVQASISYMLTANVENLILAGTAATGTGNGLDNVITGNAANNTLDGGAGNDTLRGGAGDDTYIVADSGDSVVETAGAGTDTVRASVSYTLGANLENLVLTGVAALTGTGNSADNVITGNNGGDALNGLIGNDTLIGGAGADTLNGGAGVDSMAGGAGADLYIVDNSADVITELNNGGLDTVQASVSYTLSTFVEDLVLTGSGDIDGVGNNSDNDISAGSGANSLAGGGGSDALHGGAGADTLDGGNNADTLDGGIGADSMIGGAGNDLYIVDNAGDVIVEIPTGGLDTVQSSISYALGANLENLFLTGNDTLAGTGNALNNTLKGNGKDNVLNGEAGDDVINGGHGRDTATYADAVGAVTVSLAISGAQNTGSEGMDTLSSIEKLVGSNFNDTLTGDNKGNALSGGGGADTLTGGHGGDVLTGGAGADTFNYTSLFDSHARIVDLITDLNNADVIDLHTIDANAKQTGDQAFTLVTHFDKHAGQLVVSYNATTNLTTISGDVDGDGKADLIVTASGDHHDYTNFVL